MQSSSGITKTPNVLYLKAGAHRESFASNKHELSEK